MRIHSEFECSKIDEPYLGARTMTLAALVKHPVSCGVGQAVYTSYRAAIIFYSIAASDIVAHDGRRSRFPTCPWSEILNTCRRFLVDRGRCQGALIIAVFDEKRPSSYA